MTSKLYLNGQLVVEEIHETIISRNRLLANGVMVLGQDQDELGGGFEKQQSLSGSISALNIWSRILSPQDIKSLSECTDDYPGDVLNWYEAEWELSKVEKRPIDSFGFCNGFPPRNYMMFPERRSLSAAQELCSKMGGKVSVPNDASENAILTKLATEYYRICDAEAQSGKTFWVGIEPDGVKGWKDLTNNERLNYANWKEGEGVGTDNCAYVITGEESVSGKWGDAFCSSQSPRRFCTICEFFERKMEYSLRGLCAGSRHDRVFTLERTKDNKPYLKGASTSIISWDEKGSRWHLNHLRYRAEAFYSDATKVAYPIGRKEWEVFDRLCGSFTGVNTSLTLTICNENEFTCDDGSCQPLYNRCDLKGDCPDRSDEVNCSKLVFPADYEKNLPPKHTINRERSTDPLPVYLSVDITNFDKIDNLNMMFSVMLRLNVSWKDRRLDYLNIRKDIYQNLVPFDESERIWIPQIGFYNAKTGPLSKDDHYALMIRRDSKPKPFDPSRSKEDYMYEGWQNTLMFIRRYYAEYHCTFNLRYFPFDKQRCTMIFKMRTATKDIVKLMNGGLKYKGPENMIEFHLSKIIMEEGSDSATRSEQKIIFILDRQYAYHLITSFFQSFLLGLLAYLTFFIDVKDFTDRFMGTLTVLLVLASIQASINTSLPKTSYFKMIDVWMMFFLISTSINIAVHIFIDFFLRREARDDVFSNAKKDSKIISNKKEPKLPMVQEVFGYGETDVEKSEKELSDNWKKLANVSVFHAKVTRSRRSRITAQGINDFQKTLFPCAFLIFILGFFCIALLKAGTVDLEDIETEG